MIVRGSIFGMAMLVALSGYALVIKLEGLWDKISLWEDVAICLLLSLMYTYKIAADVNTMEAIGCGSAFGILLTAMLSDKKICMVHRFWWWLFGVIALSLMIERTMCELPLYQTHLWEWIIFCILQYLLFSHMYGRADCHGFCSFGFLLYRGGNGIAGMLLHMLISIFLLGIVQLVKGNVNRKGNLKQPVAFLPYMTMAFLILC